MKTLGLCFVLLGMLTSVAVAQSSNFQLQSRPSTSGMNLDNDAMNHLLESQQGSKVVRFYRFRPDSWAGESKPTCGTMRTYRVKREPDSDVVHPSGYTTCVPLAQFRMQEAVPKLEPDPEE